MLATLLALAIVGILAGTVLRQYTGGTGTGTKGERDARDGSGRGVVDVDPTVTAPRDAMNRARGLEDSVRQQADERGKRIDEGSK